MNSNPYVTARLTANGPDYRGELHATPYNGPEEVEPLTDEAVADDFGYVCLDKGKVS